MTSVLVLGGTRFTGRALVGLLVASNYDVTVISRVRSDVVGVRSIVSEVELGLAQIKNQKFDFTFDFFSNSIMSINYLFSNVEVGYYIFISTVWINKEFSKKRELAPLFSQSQKYIENKRIIERFLYEKSKEIRNISVIRLPIQSGHNDHTKRLQFYKNRIEDGNKIILIDGGRNIVQIVDSFDVATILEKMLLKISEISHLFLWDCLSPEKISIKEILKNLSNNREIECIDLTIFQISIHFPDYLYVEPFWSENCICGLNNNLFKFLGYRPNSFKRWSHKITIENDLAFKRQRKKEIDFIKVWENG
jgi:nucleoside-diphosphate-sugar epimerase